MATGMVARSAAALAMARLDIADKVGFDPKRLFLGGDHLGPLTFAGMDEAQAMENAEELIRHYVGAGFTKIHIDTSMKVASDDPNTRLSDETIAKRGARLARVAQDTYHKLLESDPDAIAPFTSSAVRFRSRAALLAQSIRAYRSPRLRTSRTRLQPLRRHSVSRV